MYAKYTRLGPREDRKEFQVSKFIRQSHRWISMAFTLTVAANFITMAFGTPPAWVTYSPLLPLFLLLFSGLYMFFLPYAVKWRGTRAASG